MEAITISPQIKKVTDLLGSALSESKLRWVVKGALDGLALQAQGAIQGGMPSKFTLRRQWVVTGIRAYKSTTANLEASVVSLDSGGRRPFMTLQEFGGMKVPQSARTIAIPLRGVRPNKADIVPNYLKPKSLLLVGPHRSKTAMNRNNRAAAIVVQSKANPSHKFILIRRNGKYVPGWLLVRQATIHETDFFYGPAKKVLTPENVYRTLLTNVKAELKF
jgi:hypothetical protein